MRHGIKHTLACTQPPTHVHHLLTPLSPTYAYPLHTHTPGPIPRSADTFTPVMASAACTQLGIPGPAAFTALDATTTPAPPLVGQAILHNPYAFTCHPEATSFYRTCALRGCCTTLEGPHTYQPSPCTSGHVWLMCGPAAQAHVPMTPPPPPAAPPVNAHPYKAGDLMLVTRDGQSWSADHPALATNTTPVAEGLVVMWDILEPNHGFVDIVVWNPATGMYEFVPSPDLPIVRTMFCASTWRAGMGEAACAQLGLQGPASVEEGVVFDYPDTLDVEANPHE